MPGINAQRRSNSGNYYRNNTNYVSVTTILGALAKPALTYWSAKEVAEFAVENWDGPIAALMATGQRQAAVDLLKGAPWRSRDEAAAGGTKVHKIAEDILNGFEPDIPLALAPQVEAFLNFNRDFSPTTLFSEVTIFNYTVGYAGTCDLICRIGDDTWLIDYKAGKGVYPEYGLQVNAYARGEIIADGDDDVPMPAIDKVGILHLKKNGRYDLVPVVLSDQIFKSFRHIVECYRWTSEISETVLGASVRPQGEQLSLG
jgi:hypothetical protein